MPTSPGAISPVPCPSTCMISPFCCICWWQHWWWWRCNHRNNPRLIQSYPDFHSVPKLFKTNPAKVWDPCHSLFLTWETSFLKSMSLLSACLNWCVGVYDEMAGCLRIKLVWKTPCILFEPIGRGGIEPASLVLERLVWNVGRKLFRSARTS